MGLLGQYIDALPDEARDRIIREQEWLADGTERQDLIDCVERPSRGSRSPGALLRWSVRLRRVRALGLGSRRRLRERFSLARARVGTERLIRLAKLRAGRYNRLPQAALDRHRRDVQRDG